MALAIHIVIIYDGSDSTETVLCNGLYVFLYLREDMCIDNITYLHPQWIRIYVCTIAKQFIRQSTICTTRSKMIILSLLLHERIIQTQTSNLRCWGSYCEKRSVLVAKKFSGCILATIQLCVWGFPSHQTWVDNGRSELAIMRHFGSFRPSAFYSIIFI